MCDDDFTSGIRMVILCGGDINLGALSLKSVTHILSVASADFAGVPIS